jgi:uncharacterized protein YuzE
MATLGVERVLTMAPHLLGLAHRNLWTRYDRLADVLYVNVKRPSRADDSEITDEDIIVRNEGSQVVGVTILHASKRPEGIPGRQGGNRGKRGERVAGSADPSAASSVRKTAYITVEDQAVGRPEIVSALGRQGEVLGLGVATQVPGA